MEIIRTPETQEEWSAYYALRYKVLRAPLNQPKGSEINDGDKTAQHFALFYNGKIAAVARLDQLDQTTNQVRFVAVDFDYHRKGLGKRIMEALEEKSREAQKSSIVLHARENALNFYTCMGYILEEKSHLLYGQIQHYKMSKAL
ncbi:MAG: GNAT family N-acetyltransferase [Lishizhenia sp.]